MEDKIKIKGAREHNLKNISLEIPKHQMVLFTGLSGSGKSSLAFDTLFAEGQRRYIESLSAYARQFLGKMQKPDVDEITGLSPAISIDQKSHSANPRSTVATITEIYDYLRVLFARVGVAHCPVCGRELRETSVDEIVDAAAAYAREQEGRQLYILSPVVRGRKGEYYQLLYDFLSWGYAEARIDGNIVSLRDRVTLEKNKRHTIELVVDKIPFGMDFSDKDNRLRLAEAVESAVKYSNGLVALQAGNQDEVTFSTELMCPDDGISFPEIEPRLFSFNSPYGACEACHGLGTDGFMSETLCPVCEGKRLRPEALSVLVGERNIAQATAFSIEEAYAFFTKLGRKRDKKFSEIAEAPLREIVNRLQFLLDVGLEYLTLDRKAGTLSGGESQRIRLASQIGSGLTGTLYVLDEPTIGLHQCDNEKLVKTLHRLRDLGNTVIVVEHDPETILSGDYLVDVGPGPGVHGGEIVAQGSLPGILKDTKVTSLTLDYLRGDKEIPIPERRKVGSAALRLEGVSAHNLRNINVSIPLQRLSVLSGVSGSGKSTLMMDVLYKALSNALYHTEHKVGKHKRITGTEYVNRVIDVDQSPIGRTPRSNPATYVGAWGHIRDLFASTEEARIRGYKPGRFSFNVPGGRCEKCGGYGYQAVEMHFLPTVYVTCDACEGKRYNRETLEVEYHDKTIYDVLRMTVEESLEFFGDIPWLRDRLKVLSEVGLEYLELGQPAPTLSGGEAQRVKLAKELGEPNLRRRTLYLLDEPTTGLHFDDVKKLIDVLQKLIERGNTILVIEHNLDVIKSADWVIDLGPGGGVKGGKVVATGTPEDIALVAESETGKYLKKVLK